MSWRRLCAVGIIAAACSAGGAVGWSAAWQSDGTIATVTGNGAVEPGEDGDPAAEVAVDHPRGLAIVAGGGFLVAEPFVNTVQRVSKDGRIYRAAGTRERGYSGDGGPAVAAQLDGVHGVATTPDGGFVLADTGNHVIRRVWPSGVITTLAGTGARGFSGDGGPAVAAQLDAPRGVAALPDGGVLIADASNHRVRRVWPDGTITTVAGTGAPGYSGDGGAATAAQLNLPFGVTPLADGGFVVADAGNDRVRRVSADGTITTVAGTGVPGFSGDGGPAGSAALHSPHNVAALQDGGFLIADTFNDRIRRVWPDGVITTVAGTGVEGFSGDGGPATGAELNLPKALAVLADASGFLIADAANNRVRLVRINLRPPLELRVTTPRVRSKAGRPATIRYRLSEAAAVRLSVLRRGKIVLRVSARSLRGPNRLGFGSGLRPGSYGLRLVGATPDGRSARTTASLVVAR